MNRRDFSTRFALTTLAGALPGLALAQGGPVEGRHYQKLGTPVPVAAGKIEVVEFFWYGCPHCFAFEPVVEAWTKQLPADVGFRRSHVAFRENTKTHQRSFFALEALGREAEFRPKIFNAIHQQRQQLDTADSMAAFWARTAWTRPSSWRSTTPSACSRSASRRSSCPRPIASMACPPSASAAAS